MRAIFKNLCPNCNGDIDDDRAFTGLPCRHCLPVEQVTGSSLQTLIVKPSRSYLELISINEQLNKFTSFFEKATDSQPWAAQRVWARRIFSGRSFALIAPTGMGKTVFGSIIALFLAREKNWKSYILVPTALLAKQVSERILKYSERTGLNVKIAYYHSLLTDREARSQLEKIKTGEYDILVTTLSFLNIRFNLLEGVKFNFIFVDDVDSLLRASRNIDKVLMLLGFDQEDLKNASNIISLRRELGRTLRRRSFSEASKIYDEVLKLMSEFEAKRKNVGVLVVSGASIRARRTRHALLFGELLGFEISSRIDVGRNVADLYVESKNLEEDAYKLIEKLGPGGLLYIPMNLGAEYADKFKNFLAERGVKAESLTRVRKRVLEKFSEGVYDVLIGVASYRSPLVRGIDLPYRVRYALFIGVPKMHIDLDVKQRFRISKAIILLANIMELLPERDQAEALRLLNELRVASRIIPLDLQDRIATAIAKDGPLPPIPERARITIEEALEFLRDILSRGELLKALEESPYIGLEKEDGVFYLVVPDPVAYIQASGRTSRMYAGGVSRGLSIVLVDNRKAFNGLMRETRWFIEDINWRSLSDVNLDNTVKSVDEDRRAIKDLMDGKVKAEFKDLVKAALFIVESPNKARTIARLFGRPSKRRVGNLTAFEVNTGDYILTIAATGGHVMDLTIEDVGLYGVIDVNGLYVPVYSTIKRCFKCGYTFVSSSDMCPICGSGNIHDKSSVIDSLRNLAKEVDLAILGTDADAEGEKIAWDLHTAIKPFTGEVKRAEFHEVTRRALREAFKNLRDINLSLVEAQITRRIEDRWIGFELSQRLWKTFGSRRLSAGRVQTPVLGWIISRMYESKRSVREFFELKLENGLKIVIPENRMYRKELRHYMEELKNAQAEVAELKAEVVMVNPPPPFTTDSMLKEASASMGLGANEAMALAQDLFELGLITYHRTDSHRVSQVGIEVARDYITSKFGSEFVTPRVWHAEGAHECIRPTRSLDAARIRELMTLGLMRFAKRLTHRHLSLYELIFQRFIASQMKPVKAEKLSFKVKIQNRVVDLEGYSKIVENGFNLVKPIRIIPPVKEGFMGIVNVRHWRAPSVPLYTQGDVIAMMKERGIGRPSTYAKIVETLFERGYVLASKNRKSLIPTRMGISVFNYLNDRFGPLISEETTRKLEEAMWLIENGKLNHQDIIRTLRIEIDGIRSMS